MNPSAVTFLKMLSLLILSVPLGYWTVVLIGVPWLKVILMLTHGD